MRDDKNRRTDNARLVRLPDGRLVSEEEARKLSQAYSANKRAPLPENQSVKAPQEDPKSVSRRERKTEKLLAKKANKEHIKPEKDILGVWEEQERLKKESERLELEYQLAKKMAKDLKRKIKVRDQPYEGVDEAFKDLLSPETKDMARKLKPHIKKAKTVSKDKFSIVKVRAKKIGRFTRLLAKKSISSKKSVATTFAAVFLLVGCVALLNIKREPNVEIKEVQGAKVQSIPLNQKPEFGVLAPANKSEQDLGGFAKISPAESAPAYAYKDINGAVPIKVTQQELPAAFKVNPSELENLAAKYNATKLIQIDTVATYAGTSEKGPQTLIFTKEGLLVFIVAERELPDVEWVKYITNLVKK